MKRTFTKLMAALALLTLIALPMKVWADETTIASWGKVSIAANTAIKASGGDAQHMNSAQFTSTKAMNSGSGTYCYYGSAAGGAVITFSNLDLSGYEDVTMTFYARASQQGNMQIAWSANGTSYTNLNSPSISKSEEQKTSNTIPNNAKYIKLSHNKTSGSLYFGTIVIKGTAISSGIATTTTINYSGITNTNVYNGTAAGSLSATVTPEGGTALASPTIIWSSSNTGVANVASDGTVTLVAAGTTTITASYAGDDTYSASWATYSLTVTNDNPDLVTIWSENFSNYSSGVAPSGGTYAYVCEDGSSDTKIYNESLAGGTAPELLVGKSGGSFSATISLLTSTYGYSGNLILTFKANNTNVSVSTTTDGVTVTGSIVTGTSTLTLSGVTTSTENVVITFTNSASSNVRIDDIVLKGVQAPFTTVATPVFNPASGAVVSGTEVAITCATAGASIYYTTDGSEPTSNSTLYNPSNKPTVTASTTIKAIAIKDGFDDSDVATAEYVIQYILMVDIENVEYFLFDYHDGDWLALPEDAQGRPLVLAGTDVRISVASVVDCYALQGFSVNYGSTTIVPQYISEADGFSFTMPASNATLSAQVEAVTYTIQYSVNGAVVAGLTQTVNCGSSATLPTTGITVPEGYTFAGWSTSESNTTRVPSYTPTADATLYAVFASNDVTTKTYSFTISTADFNKQSYDANNGTHTSVATASTSETMDVTWTTSNVMLSNDGASIQWRKNPGGSLSATDLGTIISVDIDETSDNALTLSSSGGSFSIDNNGKATGYASTVEVVFEKSTTSYYTLVKDVTGTETMANIEACHLITVKDGGVLTLTGTNNAAAANLVIEDGGQYYGNGVKATMQKVILPYSTEQGDNDKWYAISMPFNYGINPGIDGYMTEMVTDVNSEPTYDFYRFDNIYDGAEWRNFRQNDGFGMTIGQGYLYAHKNGITLNFTGTLNATGENIQSIGLNNAGDAKPFADWFFAGNPFPCNATIDGFADFYVINEVEGKSEFTLSEGGILNPLEGAMIYDQNAAYNMTGSYKITYVPASAPDASVAPDNTQSMINLSLSKNRGGFVDCARVRFDEGGMLPKFQLNPNSTKLYIPQGSKDYAVVRSAAQGEMPVNFKAENNGTYTLSVNAENVEMNYLHLIDNLTGTDVDLLATPSYTFEASNDDYESRFKLVFKANTGVEENAATETFAYYNGSSWTVSNVGDATLQVIDMMGRVLSSETLSGNANVNINQPAGIYMLRLVNGENVKVQKVVVR